MPDLWIVRMDQGTYGPFSDREEAVMFAAYLTDEVDPASVEELRSPVRELLAWRAATLAARKKYR